MSNQWRSQEYIPHLRRKVREAERIQKRKAAVRDTKKSYSENAVTWRDKLKVYFDKIENTEKLAQKVFDDIDKLATQARTVNSNVEEIAKAIRLLVCNVRGVSQSLDDLTQKYQSIKNDIDNAGMVSKSFKPNLFMAEFNKLGGEGGQLSKASAACAEALTKALDLLKAIYLLHYGMDSSQLGAGRTYRTSRIIDESITINEDEIIYTTVFEEIEAKILGQQVKIPGGLEWSIAKLRALFDFGLPQPEPDSTGNHYPCDITMRVIPNFPLKGPGRYYNLTEYQYNLAKDKAEKAADRLTDAEKELQSAESSYTGLKAALDAAEAAKNSIKK